MPAISFQPEFRDKILSGEKFQTIRKFRKNPILVDDILYLYINQRSKNNEYLGFAKCYWVREIEISEMGIKINGFLLDRESSINVAWWDGFEGLGELMKWFRGKYELSFRGQIIRWERIEHEL